MMTLVTKVKALFLSSFVVMHGHAQLKPVGCAEYSEAAKHWPVKCWTSGMQTALE